MRPRAPRVATPRPECVRLGDGESATLPVFKTRQGGAASALMVRFHGRSVGRKYCSAEIDSMDSIAARGVDSPHCERPVKRPQFDTLPIGTHATDSLAASRLGRETSLWVGVGSCGDITWKAGVGLRPALRLSPSGLRTSPAQDAGRILLPSATAQCFPLLRHEPPARGRARLRATSASDLVGCRHAT